MSGKFTAPRALKVCTLTLKQKDGELSTLLEWHSTSGLNDYERLEALADIREAYLASEGKKTLCAWCEAEAGRAPRDGSHGICARHLREMTSELREMNGGSNG